MRLQSVGLTRSPGAPGNLARSSSRWEATPTGQLLVWHTRAMMHPVAIMATVPKPNSSPPRAAAIRTSRPERMPPSARRTTPSRSSLATRVCRDRGPMLSVGEWLMCQRTVSQGIQSLHSRHDLNRMRRTLGFVLKVIRVPERA